jgi:hypothetical protein
VKESFLTVSRNDDSTIAQINVELLEQDARRIKQDAKAYVEGLDKWARQQGFDVADKSLKQIANMPEKASFSMDGNKISAKVVMANEDLAGLIVTLAAMTPEDLVETLPKM